ncbi:hypothetical protein BU24DRAFT_446385 [Aaosphaeria arxii CBS 175.79]|uniref:PPPDE domain-containing protein n=1 Tax=Aaosphaeria arxii CBS 175.79 TaxID=1450172 RepID=A0A6A5Y960_9PLEO|nr:uncharacterized protein BU24DRAFT_446385 [Aaosphaeria arxii CBS 175.79]KAF2021350.1 hypothetical protein BU24DRAFT_446385 [Aaosphaeria arxii CBS 175.79]
MVVTVPTTGQSTASKQLFPSTEGTTPSALVKYEQDNESLVTDDGEDRRWREQVHRAAEETGNRYHSFYQHFGSNSSSDSVDQASYAQVPRRIPETVVETNANRSKRIVYIKHRPLREWMETKGAKGLTLRVLSHLQIAAHWGLAVGPYTYDIHQNKGAVIFSVGKWRTDGPGGKNVVKIKEVGLSCMTDMEILRKAERIFEKMRPDGYDEKFNNCHRFVNVLAERISIREEVQHVTLRVRLLYIWNSLPASHLFQAGEYTKQLVRLPKKVLLENLIKELRSHGYSDPFFWDNIRKQGKIASKAILFLLTVGAMTVFLQMARALTRWDPEDPKHRELYIKMFTDYVPGVSEDLANTYLLCAFEGPKGLRKVVDKLITTASASGGTQDFLKKSFKQLKNIAP